MSRKAIALILSISVLIAFVSISVPILSRSVSESNLARRYVASTKAFWGSEAGVQRAIKDLASDSNLTSWGDDDNDGRPDITFSLNTATCTVEVDLGGSNPVVYSKGYVSGITGSDRNIKVNLVPKTTHPFTYAGLSKSSLTMSGNGKTDSYDSAQGPYGGSNKGSNGDVGTNGITAGAISLSGNATVKGDALTGPGGTVKISGNAEVTESISDTCNEEIPSVTVPSSLKSLPSGGSYNVDGNDNVTISSGNYKFSSISVSGNGELILQGPMNLYLMGSSSFSISGNGKVKVIGAVKIYTDGQCDIGGNGVVNNSNLPKNFMIYSTYTGSNNGVKITGNGDLYGVIYAPDTEVKVTGNGDIFGSIVADNIILSGNGDVHYDEALASVSGPGSSGYSVETWNDEDNPYKL